ncbi:penicillin-binding protein 2 [bacterium]|nr:penicillin-binding protein 2 [bacterium]
MHDNQNLTHRISDLSILFIVICVMVLSKVFYLQVVKHDYFVNVALAAQQGFKELEANRGEIFLKDFHSQNDFRVATNVSLKTLYADPSYMDYPDLVVDALIPVLFDSVEALEQDNLRLKKLRQSLPAELEEERLLEILKPKSLGELREDFTGDLRALVGSKIRQRVILQTDVDSFLKRRVEALNLDAFLIEGDDVIAYPPKIVDELFVAKLAAPILDISVTRLAKILKGENKYVVIKKALDPAVSLELSELIASDSDKFKGLGFIDETYRHYPEKNLAANVIGYKNSQGGQYGLERYFEDMLAGENGVFKAKLDGLGQSLTVGDDTVITPAKDGSDVYLTIDRSIQLMTERLLADAVDKYIADSGQVIVMNPKTGAILAMANYPSFDLNDFSAALDKQEVVLELEDYENVERIEKADTQQIWLHEDRDNYRKLELFPVKSENGREIYFEVYKNRIGPAAYQNKAIFDVYEPGSVFKPITMAAALDVDAVTPATLVNDEGPIKVDEFTIDNALGEHYGEITMTQVLETSNNIGMAWISQKLGRRLFFSYIKKFGFGRDTGLEFYNEPGGNVSSFLNWTDSELVTRAFGQGLSVTPIQMITSFAAIANKGVLMKPMIVNKIDSQDAVVQQMQPEAVRRVVAKKTSDTLTAMLTSVVDNGQAAAGQLPGYSVAGKTGTAQTYKKGKPLEGPGTTFATFVGFLPASDPEIVVLTKIDKPRSSQWASSTALPLFRQVAEYLVGYLSISPDR